MGVVIGGGFSGGSGGGGTLDHSHTNLASLNQIAVIGPGEIRVGGKLVQEKAIESSFDVLLTGAHVSAKRIELPYDCELSRPISLVLESLPQKQGNDWEVSEKVAPEKDLIVWSGLGMERVVRVGDRVNVTYYRKEV